MRRTVALGVVLSVLLLPVATGGVQAAGNAGSTLPKVGSLQPRNADEATALSLLDMTFNQNKPEEAFARYAGPKYIQHNPMAPNGAEAVIRLMKSLPPGTSFNYDFKRVASGDDHVWVHSHVTVKGAPGRGNAVVDIFRLENGKVVEHWDVVQPVPEKSANDNTMF